MAGEVLVDALPYIDSGYDEPGVKQAVYALVEEECKRFKPSKNYLEMFGPVNLHLFETDLIKNEFERMEARQPMEMLSMKRYELPPPPANKLSDTNAWYECVENSYAQLEHQASRIINLEIMTEYGSNAWRIFNNTLKQMFEEAEKQLESISKDIQSVNLNRKSEQTIAGEKIRSLEQNWVGLVGKNYEIECAIVELEKELLEIKKKKQANHQIDAEKVPEINEINEEQNVAAATTTNENESMETNVNNDDDSATTTTETN